MSYYQLSVLGNVSWVIVSSRGKSIRTSVDCRWRTRCNIQYECINPNPDPQSQMERPHHLTTPLWTPPCFITFEFHKYKNWRWWIDSINRLVKTKEETEDSKGSFITTRPGLVCRWQVMLAALTLMVLQLLRNSERRSKNGPSRGEPQDDSGRGEKLATLTDGSVRANIPHATLHVARQEGIT